MLFCFQYFLRHTFRKVHKSSELSHNRQAHITAPQVKKQNLAHIPEAFPPPPHHYPLFPDF